jgi:hypothetical protein
MTTGLEQVISDIVKERFADAVVDSIVVEPDLDSDGDPVLWITVVFASEIAELESHRLAGLVRHVRPRLIEQKEAGFPIFRFMSKRDNDRLKREAA